MTSREQAIEVVERTMAMLVSANRQPCMSGDPRDRLSPLRRRDVADTAREVLDALLAHMMQDERLPDEIWSELPDVPEREHVFDAFRAALAALSEKGKPE